MVLQQEVVEVLRLVNEANAMSEEMDRKVKFEVILVAPNYRGQLIGTTEVMVRMKSLTSANEWVWTKNKAVHRKSLMQELYQSFITKDDHWDIPKVNSLIFS